MKIVAYRQGYGYVRDLPGHNGTVKAEGEEMGSDWGYSDNPSDSISLNVFWQRRFVKYLRDTISTGSLRGLCTVCKGVVTE
jgi:hypothetical protein